MVLGLSVFSSLLYNVYLILTSILQSLNKFKLVYAVSIVGFVTNGILDVPMMYLCNSLGIEAFYGAIISSIIGYSLSLAIGLISLHKKEGIKYKETFSIIRRDIIPAGAMVIVLLLLNKVLPFDALTIGGAILTIICDVVVGGAIFIFLAYKLNILQELLGETITNKVTSKFHKQAKE